MPIKISRSGKSTLDARTMVETHTQTTISGHELEELYRPRCWMNADKTKILPARLKLE